MAVTANPLRYDDPKKLIDAAKKDSQRNSLDNNNTNNGTAFDEIWKGIEELKKIQEGQKKLIIAKAQMPPDIEGDNSDYMNQMSAQMQSYLETDITIASMKLQIKLAEQQNKPNIDTSNLIGKEIEYSNNKQAFDGRKSVAFDYNIDYDPRYEGNNVKVAVKILNAKGEVVYRGSGIPTKGNHQFIWDGTNNIVGNKNKGGKESPGEYTIEVEATGETLKNGLAKNFNVNAKTSITTTVTAIETKNGEVIGVVTADGNTISIDEITKINGKPTENAREIQVDSSLSNKSVKINLNKIQVKNGEAFVYYNNTTQEAEKMEITIFDNKHKPIKHITRNQKIDQGINNIKLTTKDLAEVDDGYYDIEVIVTDKKDQSTTLDNNYRTVSAGINPNKNTIIDIHNNEFPAANIEQVLEYEAPILTEAKEKYNNKVVSYRDKEITYKENVPIENAFRIKAPGDVNIVTNITTYICDADKNVIYSFEKPYSLYDFLNEDSKAIITLLLRQEGIITAFDDIDNEYEELDDDVQIAINSKIQEWYREDKNNPNAVPRIKFSLPQIKESYDDSKLVLYTSWDGTLSHYDDDDDENDTPVLKATNDTKYFVRYGYTVHNPANNTNEEFILLHNSTVKTAELNPNDENKINLKLNNGDVIKEQDAI